REIEISCNQCGNTHYYNEDDLKNARYAELMNISKNLLALGAFLPLAFLPDKQVSDLKQCRECGSRNVELSEVIHRIT
ncbi:MAG: hypothetical protein GX329_08210, partial [Tissierellia bacterium]|nr:hypothetical protein [Tissierellia bacterium]